MDDEHQNTEPNAIAKAVRKIRLEMQLDQKDIARVGGWSTPSAVSNRERGKVKITYADQKKFAKAFDMTLEEFQATWRSKVTTMTNPDRIAVVNVAPAGVIVDYTEYGVDSGQSHELVDRGGISDPNAFAVRVVGDSMEPTISEGDLLIFSPVMNVPDPAVRLVDKSVVFARFGPDSRSEGCTIARYRIKTPNSGILTKDNPEYESIPVKQGDLVQLAVARQLRTDRGL